MSMQIVKYLWSLKCIYYELHSRIFCEQRWEPPGGAGEHVAAGCMLLQQHIGAKGTFCSTCILWIFLSCNIILKQQNCCNIWQLPSYDLINNYVKIMFKYWAKERDYGRFSPFVPPPPALDFNSACNSLVVTSFAVVAQRKKKEFLLSPELRKGEK